MYTYSIHVHYTCYIWRKYERCIYLFFYSHIPIPQNRTSCFFGARRRVLRSRTADDLCAHCGGGGAVVAAASKWKAYPIPRRFLLSPKDFFSRFLFCFVVVVVFVSLCVCECLSFFSLLSPEGNQDDGWFSARRSVSCYFSLSPFSQSLFATSSGRRWWSVGLQAVWWHAMDERGATRVCFSRERLNVKQETAVAIWVGQSFVSGGRELKYIDRCICIYIYTRGEIYRVRRRAMYTLYTILYYTSAIIYVRGKKEKGVCMCICEYESWKRLDGEG